MLLPLLLGGALALASPGAGGGASPGGTSQNEDSITDLDRASRLIDLTGIWLFHAGDSASFASPQTDDRSWQPVQLPSSTAHIPPNWRGTGWYRRHLQVGRWAQGARQLLSLGNAGAVAEIYVNGVLLAERGQFGSRRRGGTRVLPLTAILPEGLLVAGDNVLAVRLYEPTFSGGLIHGPLLLGPPNEVRAEVVPVGQAVLVLRLFLAMLALMLALGQFLVPPRSGSLMGAGLALAVVHCEGTGVLEGLIPNLDLAVRLPKVAMALAMLCLGSYFARRFDTLHSKRVRLLQVGLVAWSGAVLLTSEPWTAFIASPVHLVWAMLLTFYGAHLLTQAARRQEVGTLPLFVALLALIGLMMRDALFPNGDVWLGSWSAGGAVGLLILACASAAQTGYAEHRRVLSRLLRLEKQNDERVWLDVLAATASAIDRPHTFLDAVAHDVARQLESRRCSIILPDRQGTLHVAACRGLPRQAWHQPVAAGPGIANAVFSSGAPITSTSVLPDLMQRQSARHTYTYDTNSFLAHPITQGGRTLGVLSVADRHDCGDYAAADRVQLQQMAHSLGLVLQALSVNLDGIVAEVTGVHRLPPTLAVQDQLPQGHAATDTPVEAMTPPQNDPA